MSDYHSSQKRKRSQSPPPWRKNGEGDRPYRERDGPGSRGRGGDGPQQSRWSHKDQMRINQLQEDERMREWVSQEDDFVLRQTKKKAEIRVKEGRARPIDWLAVTLRVVDPTRDVNPLDDEVEEKDLDFVDPESVFEGLEGEDELADLRKDIETYMNLEKNKKNRDYWRTMQIICKDRQRRLKKAGPEGRAVGSVAADIDKLLRPKTYEQLETLEGQIRAKLDSDEPIDTDYWQQLLDSLLVWKAKAKLKKVYQDVLDSKLGQLREENERRAGEARQQYVALLTPTDPVVYSKALDPDPRLEIPSRDKALDVVDEADFLDGVAKARRKVLHMGYVPAPKSNAQNTPSSGLVRLSGPSGLSGLSRPQQDPTSRFDHAAASSKDDVSSTSKALFDRDVARGVDEDEEVFAGEEELAGEAAPPPLWGGRHRPRKPKYFNRVQMGYEWNKYNQTHYDHDNPPPKVVQGYKFHIFYPDLIDPTRAPTYRIVREGGRRKGQTAAPAGEEDTCIIRFVAGPPYEDIAFRVVDRDWDYSAKHDRGFKSTFERGVLTLHFSFKRIVYRK